MIKKVLHSAFEVKDLNEAIELYKKLGFQEEAKFEKENGKAQAAVLKLDNFAFELWQFNDQGSEYYKIKDHIGFLVDDLESQIEEFKEAGARIIIPITRGITVKRYAFIENIDGKVFELVEL